VAEAVSSSSGPTGRSHKRPDRATDGRDVDVGVAATTTTTTTTYAYAEEKTEVAEAAVETVREVVTVKETAKEKTQRLTAGTCAP
jgi:acyl-[acyl carrier protein]--UDP-N-acetylglucosamine O-acyltransferase